MNTGVECKGELVQPMRSELPILLMVHFWGSKRIAHLLTAEVKAALAAESTLAGEPAAA